MQKCCERARSLTHRGWVLLALSSIPLVMTLGNSTLIPVIPIIQRQLTLSPLQASLIITVYSIVAVPLIPIAGFLSDRIGRKAVIIPSLILAGLGGMTGVCSCSVDKTVQPDSGCPDASRSWCCWCFSAGAPPDPRSLFG